MHRTSWTSLAVSTAIMIGHVAGARNESRSDEPVREAIAASESTVAVLFAPSRPVIVRLMIQIDGISPVAFRERFCNEWFQKLDQNKDGVLDAGEAGEMAAATPSDSASQSTWQQFDAAPADSRLAPDEFRGFADSVLGPPLAIVATKRAGDDAAGLFALLDRDSDSLLTADELQRSRESLAALDADDDETISVAEVNSAPQRGSVAADKVKVEQPPILILGPNTTAASIAERILHDYDAKIAQARDNALDPAELRTTPEAISRFDGDGNQKLDVGELARMIVESPPELTLSINLFDQQRGRPAVNAVSAPTVPPVEVKQASADEATLSIDGLETSIAAKRTRSSTGDSRRYYALRLKIVDKDKNGYLDAKEFPDLGLSNATFEAVDVNSDSQMMPEELANHLAKQGTVPMNQVVIETVDMSRPLFTFLDTREDRRLAPRELLSAAGRLSEVDGNKDGSISVSEMTTRIGIDVSVKRPPASRTEMGVGIRPKAGVAAVPRDRGPQWFLRMDRNYDGDVSWREFLGSRKVFDSLDADRDGLLSPDEAEAAK